MANFETSSTSFGSTGSATIGVNLGFDPKYIIFRAGKKSGTDNANHLSVGASDGLNQYAISNFSDGTSSKTDRVTNRVVKVYERVAGTLTSVLEVQFTSMNVGTGDFTVNVVTANSNYTIDMDIFG